MFYLKYRPKTIKEIDNLSAKVMIGKILESSTLPHAFLFVGQKGTGKTSTARILAKAVNCLNNKFSSNPSNDSQSYEPCNKCANCKSIGLSSFTDVIEMDAASNRGIEEIKNLIRETSFLPMSGGFRVFIIDEAHMITNEGFNALLKTLEEPPESAIFILATTNLEKLPKTIVSRCLKINFGKANTTDIYSMLKRIAKIENIDFSDDLLRLIIRGRNDLIEIIEKKDLKKTLSWIEDFSQNGGDFKSLIEDILNQLHSQLLIKNDVIKNEDNQTTLNLNEISLLMKLLIEAYQNLRNTPIDSLPVEIALIEFYNKIEGKKL
ncbi:MAG: polymerase III, subunit gamma and tau protein [Candidatus Roizmanbacteria bacterium GW2011_GWA2_33_33]|uniref:DNA polymerase III subunit gamma/tau n=1 Tax=Candidatus Roizmanbacteria bacterium GW2011_GWA2_33_33 TaxID=1618476 RepID=A0A0G0ANP6_9BACT|nr:MAG: polymerase III, subunit gamma and tau protein [Candidatus Roizmanbacteria bacterium GW2011_GWA2_33_33]